MTGVWAGDAKIASIGVGIRRWVTMHGFALNVTTDLSYFDAIVPCGIEGCRMTSIAALGQPQVTVAAFAETIERTFARPSNMIGSSLRRPVAYGRSLNPPQTVAKLERSATKRFVK